jgi:hypothetical protein
MSVLGLHLDDAAATVARDGALLSTAPSIVHADPDDGVRFGHPAADTVRRAPHRVSSTHWSSLVRGDAPARAAMPVLRAELRARVAALHRPGDALQVAVPAALDPAALAWVLGACRAESLPVTALHDAAAVAVAALGLEGAVLVLEAGLHHVAVSRVAADGGTARRRAVRITRETGLMPLRQAWMQSVAEAMLLRSRFDPLHDAASEQRLFDRIDAAAAAATAEGSAIVELPTRDGGSVSVALSRDQFAAAAGPVHRAALAMIEGLRPPGTAFTLLVPAAAATVPGLCEGLLGIPGVRMLSLPDGLVARAVSQVGPGAGAEATGTPDDAVTLHRAVTFVAPIGSGVEIAPASALASRGTPPTHVLWNGEAVALADALEVGRGPVAGGIRLEAGMAGVSRLHCSLRRSPQGAEIVDHSRYGTWLNGLRVAGRASLWAGDRIRIGDPGVELALIAVGGGADER